MPATFMTLLASRKFVANLLAIIVCAGLLYKGSITSQQFSTVLASLTGVFTLAVAHEDANSQPEPTVLATSSAAPESKPNV